MKENFFVVLIGFVVFVGFLVTTTVLIGWNKGANPMSTMQASMLLEPDENAENIAFTETEE